MNCESGEYLVAYYVMKRTIFSSHTKTGNNTVVFQREFISSLKEEILLLLQIDANEENGERLFEEAIKIVEQSLLESSEAATDRLDSALKELNGLIKGLLLSKTITDVQAIVSICEKNGMLHVSHAGRAEAYVVRSNAANQITEYSKGKTAPAFVHIASGQLEADDIALLSTERLLRTITPAQIVEKTNDIKTATADIVSALEAEQEVAAISIISVAKEPIAPAIKTPNATSAATAAGREENSILENAWQEIRKRVQAGSSAIKKQRGGQTSKFTSWVQDMFKSSSVPDSNKKHLLILAGAISIFLVILLTVNLSSFAKQSQSRSELSAMITSIQEDIRNAENRHLTGDTEASVSILDKAEQEAKTVINHESRLYRTEDLDLLEQIQSKREKVSNIIRRAPITAADLSEKNSSIQTIGFIGQKNERVIVFDRQNSYQIISNTVEAPKLVSEEELLTDGVNFERQQTQIYTTTGNGLIEIISGKPISMKTDDENGWNTGVDIETYSRFLYMLSPANNQIYKYERLSNRYGFPAEYNMDGSLSNALDMSIDIFIYILKDDGTIEKLNGGESASFTINQAPNGVLNGATKLYKVVEGKLYVLVPEQKRIVVLEVDEESGDAVYLRQYVLESDQIGTLNDIYIDQDESWLYVLDEKRLYKLELNAR